jgi:hypothetical protein
LVRAGKWCARSWTEREEDGRVRYAVAGLGLGLLVGPIAAVILDHNLPWQDYTDLGRGPASFVVLCAGAALVGIAIFWGDRVRRPRTIYESAIAKAAQDAEFREELKADPRRTIERENPGWTPPADLEITVLEGTPQHFYLVLSAPSPDWSGKQRITVLRAATQHGYVVLCAPSPDRSGKRRDAVSADETESKPDNTQ